MFRVSPVTAFLECPHCCKLLPFESKECPACRESISEEYAFASATVLAFNTQACGAANDIKSSHQFVAIALVGSVLIYLDDLYVFGAPRLFLFVVLWSLVPIGTTLCWFYRFGRFGLGDENYLRAKREMKGYLNLWLAILGLQVAAFCAGRS